MTRILSTAKTLCLIMSFMLVSAMGFSANDVDLKFNLKKGDVTKYRATIEQTTTQQMGGMDQTVNQNQIFEYTIDVKDVNASGNFVTQITYTRVAINMAAGGMNIAFDSAEEESAPANPQLMGLQATNSSDDRGSR